ncbi:MAG: hypothetical protein LBG80_00080 [Bacteroidales bacterium]|jgi:hypothetical protein|nr:hypothetical protein [Bacteroidales bacterium]
MKTIQKMFLAVTVTIVVLVSGWNFIQNNRNNDTPLYITIKNKEALTLEVGNVPWYDFFNNYKGQPQFIPVNTTTCTGGTVTYQGVTLSISSCTQYTTVIYTPCFDGGDKDECTDDIIQHI